MNLDSLTGMDTCLAHMRKPERSSELPQQMKEKELLRKNHFLLYIMTHKTQNHIVKAAFEEISQNFHKSYSEVVSSILILIFVMFSLMSAIPILSSYLILIGFISRSNHII